MTSYFYDLFKLPVLQWKHTLDSRSATKGIFRKSLHIEMPAALNWAMNPEYRLYLSEKLDKDLM